MEEIILNAETRDEVGRGRTKSLRDQGFIPAVIYRSGKEAQSLKVSGSLLIKLLHQHRLENALLHLKIKNKEKEATKLCLVKEIQYDPVHGNVIHLDFNEVSMTDNIKIKVPVTAKGEAPGVKHDGGSLDHILWEIEVECLPADIPSEIEVDISGLKIGDSIHIKDIKFPPKVKVLDDQEDVVLHVVAPMKEEVPVEAVEGEEKKEPEVIKEKKEVAAEGAEGGKEKEKEKEKEKK